MRAVLGFLRRRARVRFSRCQRPTDAEMDAVLATIAQRGRRLLVRRCGESPELAALAVRRRGPCHAHADGFDLHADVIGRAAAATTAPPTAGPDVSGSGERLFGPR
jgi:hypothetical protein